MLSNDPGIRERIDKLNDMGFNWNVNSRETDDDKFLDMIDKLINFKNEFGHTRVPVKWEDDPKLGRWVELLRKTFRQGELTEYKKIY